MKIGIEIAAAPGERQAQVGMALATRAAREGHETFLYLIDEGIRFAEGHDETVRAFTSAGGKLFVCAYSCQRRGLPSAGLPEATYCGLVTLADILVASERFLCFS